MLTVRRAYPGAAGRGLCLGDTARLPYGTRSADSVLGVLEPGAVAACCATRTGRIAVIATESTVHLPVFAPLMAPMLAAGVAIVDSAATTAAALRRALDAGELTRAAPDTGTVRLPATDGAV